MMYPSVTQRAHRRASWALVAAMVLSPVSGAALAEPLFVAATQGLWLLEDTNADRNALGPGERILFRDATGLGPSTGSGFTDVAFGISGTVYAIEPGGDRVLAMTDLNGDADAQDAGETVVWFDGSLTEKPVDLLSIAASHEFDAASEAVRDVVYVFDMSAQTILKLVDRNDDGVVGDPPETSDFHLLSSEQPFTACRLHADDLGRVFGTLINDDAVARLWNANGDGMIVDRVDPSCTTDQFAGEHAVLVEDTQALFELFGIAGAQRSGLFVSVPPSMFRADGVIQRLSDRNGNDRIDAGELSSFTDLVCRRGGRQLRLGRPTDLSIDGAGTLYVADGGRGAVLWFRDRDGDGQAVSRGECGIFAIGMAGAIGLAHPPRLEAAALTVVSGALPSDEKGLQMSVSAASGTTVEVLVTARSGGTPVAGAPVRCDFLDGCFACDPREGLTDATGRARILVTPTAIPASETGSFTLATAGNEAVLVEITDVK